MLAADFPRLPPLHEVELRAAQARISELRVALAHESREALALALEVVGQVPMPFAAVPRHGYIG